MRNSAAALGMIGGILALIMGIVSFGYTELTAQQEVRNLDFLPLPENPELLRAMSVIAPLLAIAGAGMARYRALWGGILLLVAAFAIYTTFSTFFAIFPAAMCGLAAILAIAAGRPDKEHSHF
jgi:peptidoglycan/LPS O-acetylase OafA/YrhL